LNQLERYEKGIELSQFLPFGEDYFFILTVSFEVLLEGMCEKIEVMDIGGSSQSGLAVSRRTSAWGRILFICAFWKQFKINFA